MFNPKVNNLLDEQLAVSGLEMNIIGAIAAGVGAVASIAGGIMGASQTSSNNKRAEKAEKEQRELQDEIAESRNEYNERAFEAEQANYYAMRDFNYETQLQDWKRGNEIQDYRYLQSLKEYEKSLTIGKAQLGLNAQAAGLAFDAEQRQLKEAFIQQQFQYRNTFEDLRQTIASDNINRSKAFSNLKTGTAEIVSGLKIGRAEARSALKLGTAEILKGLKLGTAEQLNVLSGIQNRREFGRVGVANTLNTLMAQNNIAKETKLVEGLVQRGATQATGQAGVSTKKTQQSNLALMQRGLMGLEAELSGSAKKAALQLAELNATLNLEETGVGLNLKALESKAKFDFKRLKRDTKFGLQRLESESKFGMKRLSTDTRFTVQALDETMKSAKKETQFNLDVMQENMKSTIGQTKRNIEKIQLDRSVADLNTKAGMMLFPERLSYNPRPKLPPERIFIEPEKAIPGYVPPAQQQNVWAPLVSGISGAAGGIASADAAGLFDK